MSQIAGLYLTYLEFQFPLHHVFLPLGFCKPFLNYLWLKVTKTDFGYCNKKGSTSNLMKFMDNFMKSEKEWKSQEQQK